MPKNIHTVRVPATHNKPAQVVATPYALTSFLFERMCASSGEAAGVLRHKDGKIEVRVFKKELQAKVTGATHAFIITRDTTTFEKGLAVTDVLALNPDIAADGQTVGLFDIPSGQLPE